MTTPHYHSAFCDVVLHHLNQVAPIAVRSRFDREELYCDRVLFALIVDDILYFKVDDRTRNDFLQAGLQPMTSDSFSEPGLSYCQVPTTVWEDRAQLALWVKQAVAVGKRSQRQQKRHHASWKNQRPLAPEG